MNFEKTLISGELIKRYKRFFVDVKINNKVITAHCPNTGSMMGLLDKGNKVWLSKTDKPNRKLKYTLQIIESQKSYIIFLAYIMETTLLFKTMIILTFELSIAFGLCIYSLKAAKRAALAGKPFFGIDFTLAVNMKNEIDLIPDSSRNVKYDITN